MIGSCVGCANAEELCLKKEVIGMKNTNNDKLKPANLDLKDHKRELKISTSIPLIPAKFLSIDTIDFLKLRTKKTHGRNKPAALYH